MHCAVIICVCLLAVSAQKVQKEAKISRLTGNILTNLTGTQQFENHIVTSQLDNSYVIRMLYRGIREMYSRMLPGTGDRHDSERFQKKVAANVRFPCRTDGFRSAKTPKSVHQLRPGGEST